MGRRGMQAGDRYGEQADHCGRRTSSQGGQAVSTCLSTECSYKPDSFFGNRARGGPVAVFGGVLSLRGRGGGRKLNPAILPYMFQGSVEISPMPFAQRCRRAFSQCPPRGGRKGTPLHLANAPGKSDAERSILNACHNQHSCQLINRALPRAGRERPAVDFAFCQPLTGAVRTAGFLERTTVDRERICHGKSDFKGPERRGSDLEVLFRCSGD